MRRWSLAKKIPNFYKKGIIIQNLAVKLNKSCTFAADFE
jgi:hypothetical protein